VLVTALHIGHDHLVFVDAQTLPVNAGRFAFMMPAARGDSTHGCRDPSAVGVEVLSLPCPVRIRLPPCIRLPSRMKSTTAIWPARTGTVLVWVTAGRSG